MNEKRYILITLLAQMKASVTDESLKRSIGSLADTVAHSAPEIIDSRWRPIYNMCKRQMNDVENSEHKKCFELYSAAIEKYKGLM